MNHSILANQYCKPTGNLGKSIGKIFDYENTEQNDWTVSLLKIKPTDYILEIGFGTGRSIKLITKLASRGFIGGIDYSKVMVEMAIKRNTKAIKAGLVKLHLRDASSLPYPNDYFNKAFAVFVIYFWRNPIKILKEIRRVLKPKGQIAIYLSAKKNVSQYPYARTGIFKSYTKKELITMLSKASFHNIKCKIKNFKMGEGICMLANK